MKPHRGKPAVRNFLGDDGNVGIVRSPVRAIALPDHTYSTLLKGNGEDVKVARELMRHANFQTTMNVYTRAITSAKRDAQTRVVDILMDRTAPVKEGSVEAAA